MTAQFASQNRTSNFQAVTTKSKTNRSRSYSIEQKVRLVSHYATLPRGQKGLFLRSNGLYYSTIQIWKQQIDLHRQRGLAMLDPNNPKSPSNPTDLETQLRQAQALIQRQQQQLNDQAQLVKKQTKLAEKHKRQLKDSQKALKREKRKLNKAKKVIDFQKKAHDYLENASRHLLAGDDSSLKQ